MLYSAVPVRCVWQWVWWSWCWWGFLHWGLGRSQRPESTDNTEHSSVKNTHRRLFCSHVILLRSPALDLLNQFKNSRLSDSRYDLPVHKLTINHDHDQGKPQADGCIYRHTNAVFWLAERTTPLWHHQHTKPNQITWSDLDWPVTRVIIVN